MIKKNKFLFSSMIIVTIIITILLTKSNCGTEKETKEEIKMKGIMIFTNGTGTICRLDLQTKRVDTVFHTEDFFNEISRISEDEFIIDGALGLVNFNYRSRSIQSTRSGSRQVYVKEHKKLFFYDNIKGSKQYYLYMASIDSLDNAVLIAKASERPKEFVSPVQISSDEIVFIGEDYKLRMYDLSNGALTPTGIDGKYNPVEWITNRKVLLCNVSGGGMENIYEINLETKEIKNTTSNYSNEVYLNYIDKYDAAVYCSMKYGLFGELSGRSFDLYIYFYKDNRNVKFTSDVRMYSAVYIDE